MQGKQNTGNMERKGPHKSMHCHFCKPPGAVAVEKPTGPQLETKTKVHLVHEAADLRLSNIDNEPGFPSVESEACICVLEGENPCPKCVPDKSRPPLKKKVCRCPKGAKPHPSMLHEAAPKKKKAVDEDDEFWWERYSREHDAMTKETWAAYMAQRRKDKKMVKCQNEELLRVIAKTQEGCPVWYQKLSCQQMLYVEFLSTAIRLDSDENITDRTNFVLGGIGLYPRPSRKLLKKCLRYCHYNAVQFLNQLLMLTKDQDPFDEKYIPPSAGKFSIVIYTWNEKLIMSSICYLEFPGILRELMDRLPPLPREEILPQIPYPVYPPKEKNSNPYEEPIWQERLNWAEKMKIDRINRCRAHMETKRVKIPSLALVRRPSLIDARPPFLAQIEANERASRRMEKEKKKKPVRKHPISTFNSAVDVTAIAGIEASEISTTDKADTDDICVFLRDPKSESEVADTEEEFPLTKEVKFLDEEENKKPCFDTEDNVEGDEEPEEIPFKTPPKTESGVTIASPCPPPDGTPGPPAPHFESGKRELDIVNEEICRFFPFASSSKHTIKEDVDNQVDEVGLKLKSAAAKLKKLTGDDTEKKPPKKKKKSSRKKGKSKKRKNKKKTKKQSETTMVEKVQSTEVKEEEEEDEEEEVLENLTNLDEDDLEGDDFRVTYRKKERYISSRDSEISDPDPESDDEWSTRPPCTPVAAQLEEQKKPAVKRKHKKKGKKKLKKKKASKPKGKPQISRGEKGENKKKKEPTKQTEAKTVDGAQTRKEENQETEKGETEEPKERDLFTGDLEPLVKEIMADLADEGFVCASFANVHIHPDIEQLILHLKGKILTQKDKMKFVGLMKFNWNNIKAPKNFRIPKLGISRTKLWLATWNDKKWISKLANAKLEQFYYRVANSRANLANDIYRESYPCYFGTDRYLKIFYAYMISKYEDAILRGTL